MNYITTIVSMSAILLGSVACMGQQQIAPEPSSSARSGSETSSEFVPPAPTKPSTYYPLLEAQVASEAREAAWADVDERILAEAIAGPETVVESVNCKTTLCSVKLRFASMAALQSYWNHDFVDERFNGRGLAEDLDRERLTGTGYVTRQGCSLPSKGKEPTCGHPFGSQNANPEN